MKITTLTAETFTLGTVAAFMAGLFGGWDSGIITLLFVIVIDMLMGGIVAVFFNNSPKTEKGGFKSSEFWKGIVRKMCSLMLVVIAVRFDILLGITVIRDAVVISLIINESVSIIENLGLMGVPIPSAIKKALEVLKDKSKEDDKEENKKDETE